MEWWLWLLIAAAGILIGFIKIAFLKSLKKKSKEKKKISEED